MILSLWKSDDITKTAHTLLNWRSKRSFLNFFVAELFTHFICREKRFTHFLCRKNDLCSSSGKFLCVEFCHPESSDFLGLWASAVFLHRSNWGERCLALINGVPDRARVWTSMVLISWVQQQANRQIKAIQSYIFNTIQCLTIVSYPTRFSRIDWGHSPPYMLYFNIQRTEKCSASMTVTA